MVHIFAILIAIAILGSFVWLQVQPGSPTDAIEEAEETKQLMEEVTAKSQKAVDDIEQSMSAFSARLDLSSQGLTSVPDYVFTQEELQELDLSNNQFGGALPGEIRFLSNLKVLNLSNNEFTGVPAEIGQLTNLEILNLSNNFITGLPYELGNLKKLKVLDLRGNKYSKQDLEIIKSGLPDTVEVRVDN